MELVSTRGVLSQAQQLREAHWEFASREANEEPLDRRSLDDSTFERLGDELLKNLNRLSGMNDAFIAAAQGELRLTALLKRESSDRDDASAPSDADRV
jgi:hypothetical protein